MEVRNCRDCGKLFNYVSGQRLCPACIKKLEEKFVQVKEYIKDNPHAQMRVISDENNVSITQIKQWVRQERLIFDKDSPIALECETCGSRILTGRYCQKCKNEVKNGLNQAISKPKKIEPEKKSKEKEKMRFLDT